MHPFPKNLGDILKSYDKVLIPELNTGQLRLLIRATYLVDAVGFNKIQGKPFLVHEIVHQIDKRNRQMNLVIPGRKITMSQEPHLLPAACRS